MASVDRAARERDADAPAPGSAAEAFQAELERLAELSQRASPACERFEREANALTGLGRWDAGDRKAALKLLETYPGRPAATQEIEARFLAGTPEGLDAARVMTAFGGMETCRFQALGELVDVALERAPSARQARRVNEVARRLAWDELKGPGAIASTVIVLGWLKRLEKPSAPAPALLDEAIDLSRKVVRQLQIDLAGAAEGAAEGAAPPRGHGHRHAQGQGQGHGDGHGHGGGGEAEERGGDRKFLDVARREIRESERIRALLRPALDPRTQVDPKSRKGNTAWRR